ncbi:MAG: type II/IV secretion system protein [Candidatus Taylorbacteria bacterium]|nr:type II/IV secretion system protein [Candidatus Taylorbacteria bacterium]
MSVVDILLKKNVITKEDVQEVRKMTASGDVTLEKALIDRGVKPEDILIAKGEFMNVPIRALQDISIPFEILEYIPEESAIHYKFVPLALKDGALEVGIVDPDNIEARDALNFIAAKKNVPYKIFIISTQDFEKVIEMYKGITGEVSKALSELETVLSVDSDSTVTPPKGAPIPGSAGGAEPLIIEDAPVVKIVATIVRYATEGNASDVHIEPMHDKFRVRFRVDGVLNTSLVLPMKVHSAVVARIKVLSNMKLDEKRKPQDGRFSARIEGRRIDFRVSTFPAYYGEKVVMRILDPDKGVKKLDDVGLTPTNLARVRDAIHRPYGLILITGPTGSGKSTTLYSMLNEVDKEAMNVLSLEDPVEYNMEGIAQSQVHPEIGYTFASGLRTTLRQDPDVIMVGEIRDKETAQLAVQAALTGHLVFSTLHTNNAAGVIPRLIDMGVDPYLIAPTLICAMAQRLVRTLCPGGGKPIPVEGAIKAIVDKQFGDFPAEFRSQIEIGKTVYEAVPTPECPKGTRGRQAVFEVFMMDKEIESVLMKSPTELEISKILRQKGMLTMKEDAMLKAFKGLIPFEEVNTL